MKKLCFLFCMLSLLFSLCSCGGKAAEKQTVQPEGKRTAEEAIESGVLLSTVDLMDEVEKDAESANKTYAGKYYLMNLVVDRLNDPNTVRAGFNIRGSHLSFIKSVYFTVDLSGEERKDIAYGDVLQVAGKISNIEKRFNGATFVEITDARIVTKTFQISGEVKKAVHSDNWGYYLVVSDDSGNVFPDSEIRVFLQEEGNYTEGDRITATGTLIGGLREGTAGASAYAWPFAMDDPERMEIEGP